MKKYDLTRGGIINKILLVALPIMATQLIQMTYNLTDMFWLGKLSNGSDAVAASGSAGMFMWLSMAFLLIGRTGAEIGVSQNLGRDDEQSAKEYSQSAVFIAALLGIICAVAAVFFSGNLISIFNIREQNVADAAAKYLSIVGAVCPATFISASLIGTFNGSGNSRVSLMSNATGLVINMILDPVLIFVFKMEIMGAAIATAIAQVTVLVIFLISIKKNKGRPFKIYKFFVKPAADKIVQIFRWSLPVALESLIFTLLAMMITRLVTGYGSDALAAQRVGSQIESLSWLIGGGFGSAITAFIGQNYGAGKWTRIHKGFRISTIVMICWGVIITLIMYFGGKTLFSIFLSDESILVIGESFLKALALSQVFACLEAISAGVFRGIGKTIPPSLTSITVNALRVPLVYALTKTSLGLSGIWWGISIGGAARGICIFVWYLIHLKKLPKNDTAVNAAIEIPLVQE